MHCTAMCLSNPFPVSARQKLYSFEIFYDIAAVARSIFPTNKESELSGWKIEKQHWAFLSENIARHLILDAHEIINHVNRILFAFDVGKQSY